MKKIIFVLFLFTLCFANMWSCAPGNSNTSTGSLALSLQLSEEQNFFTEDGYQLTFQHFALSFSKITVANLQTEESFSADFALEEVADIVEIENVPGGEYDEVSLTLSSEGLAAESKIAFVANLKSNHSNHEEHGDSESEVPEELEGNSVFIQASAQKDGNSCSFILQLASDDVEIEVSPEGQEIDVEPNTESELLVVVNPNVMFQNISLGADCTGDAELVFSSTSNSSTANQMLNGLVTSFELGSTSGHSH